MLILKDFIKKSAIDCELFKQINNVDKCNDRTNTKINTIQTNLNELKKIKKNKPINYFKIYIYSKNNQTKRIRFNINNKKSKGTRKKRW